MDLSVIIAAYNAERTLSDAIGSALALSDTIKSEIIVVNDGSCDGTVAQAESFGDRIKLLTHKNIGAARSRTRGGREAKGKWLVFLDADDLFIPEGVEALLGVGECEGADVVYGGVREKRSRDELIRFHPGLAGEAPWPARVLFWKNLVVAPGSAIVRRRLFDRVGGFSKDQPSDDRSFWLRCGVYGKFWAEEKLVLEKRLQPESVSHQRDRSIFHQYLYLSDFLDWCVAHDVDPDCFGVEKKRIYEIGLSHALEERSIAAFFTLLSIVRVEGWRTPMLDAYFRWRFVARIAPVFIRRRYGPKDRWVSHGLSIQRILEGAV